MWLVAGLGNPGREYSRTRHNLGFMLLDRLSLRWGVPMGGSRGGAERGRGTFSGQDVLLVKPLGFMNRSGEVLAPIARMAGVEPERLLVLFDDMDLPLGTVRYRPRGSAGGHHGIESLITCLGTAEFGRIRMGIGRPADRVANVGHVLSAFSRSETPLVESVLEASAQLAEEVVAGGRRQPLTITLSEEQKEKKEEK